VFQNRCHHICGWSKDERFVGPRNHVFLLACGCACVCVYVYVYLYRCVCVCACMVVCVDAFIHGLGNFLTPARVRVCICCLAADGVVQRVLVV
jgi:hypothetical protein